jgi:hypothetical protein
MKTETIKRIKIFDLDETIIRAPGYSSLKSITDQFPAPYLFYDNKISLDSKIFNIQFIEPVISWITERDQENSINILITHRVKELEEEINQVLSIKDLQFKEKFFLGRTTHKGFVLEDIIKKYPEADEFLIFEDQIAQILNYLEISKNYPDKKFQYWQVDKARIFKIENLTVSEEKRIKLV